MTPVHESDQGDGEQRPLKILVAVDGTEPATRAGRRALQLARDTGGSIALIHVSPPFVAAGDSSAAANELLPAVREAGVQVLRQARDALGAPRETLLMSLVGPAAELIAAVAREQRFDLVAIGCSELGVVGRLFMGSVCDDLLNNKSVPVLVVP